MQDDCWSPLCLGKDVQQSQALRHFTMSGLP